MSTRSRRNYLTISEFCAELDIARSTFYEWRAKGLGPACIRLPNGSLRIKRDEFENWIEDRKDVA